MTTKKQVRKAFWEAHPELEAHALKWQIKSAAHNRHNTTTREAFCDYIEFLRRNKTISEKLMIRATL
jgi:hypothetical protein